MTATIDDTGTPAPDPPRHRRPVGAGDVVREVCPYLVASSGSWRSSDPSREHRCAAVAPPAPLAPAKQRALCLVESHEACATYRAARELAASAARPGRTGGADLWPPVRTIPLMLEPVHGRLAPLADDRAKAGGQALLIGLMVVAFLVLVIARTTAPPAEGAATPPPSVPVVGPGPSSTPGTPAPTPPPATASPATPSPSAPGPSPTAGPSASPTAPPSPSPTAAGRTYRVKAGDTLSGIAAQFGTTVKAIADANGLTDPRLIHVGDVLVIP